MLKDFLYDVTGVKKLSLNLKLGSEATQSLCGIEVPEAGRHQENQVEGVEDSAF